MSKAGLLAVTAAALLAAGLPARAQQADFPDGPGKETFLATCGACHDINRARAGYTPDGWRTVMQMMVNFGGAGPKDQVATLTEYLIKSFPERARPAAKIVEGPVQASIKLWDVPTPGSRPHDPLAAKDGAIWYTGQMTNKLGPKTGNVTEYKMPDPAAKDPHTIAIDHQSGIVWFTLQQANMIGRLDPKTGEVKLVTAPTPKSRPYGLLINSKGVPVYCAFGTNKLATVDPKTMAIKEYALPNAESRPRRIALTDDDAIWYADYSRGYLGRFDPKTGEVKEWPSPSGPKSAPYGISSIKNVIWYSESEASPNTVVRFDPKTEKFQSWAIPGGGDIVRNMDVTPDGNPVTANSLANQVGLVS